MENSFSSCFFTLQKPAVSFRRTFAFAYLARLPASALRVLGTTRRRSQDKEVAVVVSFLEIYCDRVRDLGEAYMPRGDSHGLRTTSDVHQKMKSVRSGVCLSFRREVQPGPGLLAT